jgi:endonuclease/exonuclease/phosphatase family metal-dependent hydrolase
MPLEVATFNVSLNRDAPGQLIDDLATPDDAQAQAVAEIIQRANPDVILLNEVDHDPDGAALRHFQDNYLGVAQADDTRAVTYDVAFLAPSNTGVPSGRDINGNGTVGTLRDDGTISDPNDAHGFGNFPGQFGMAVLSRHPIDQAAARTFQEFRWQDLPGNLLPVDAYPEDVPAALRLSSKSHWDLPVRVDGETVHILASHPTPPVFDDPAFDQNGRRNFDEIRFWDAYITPGNGDVFRDDQGRRGELPDGAAFVIVGDLNADPHDGDSRPNAATQLLGNPRVDTSVTPASTGGLDAAARQGSNNLQHETNAAFDTADFGEARFGGPGNLRVDYALPSAAGFDIIETEVFWPAEGDPTFDLTGPGFPPVSSDHRLVSVTLAVQSEAGQAVAALAAGYLGRAPGPEAYDTLVADLIGGRSIRDIATALAAGDEAQTVHGFLAAPREDAAAIARFLESVYQALFGRAPGDEGRDYWTGEIQARLAADEPIGAIILDIASGARGADAAALAHRAEVGVFYAEAFAHGATGWTLDDDAAGAMAVLADVTADAATVAPAKAQARDLIAADPGDDVGAAAVQSLFAPTPAANAAVE